MFPPLCVYMNNIKKISAVVIKRLPLRYVYHVGMLCCKSGSSVLDRS